MRQRRWRWVVALWVAAVLSGCSSEAVRCDRHLTPINVPRSSAAEPGTRGDGVGATGVRDGRASLAASSAVTPVTPQSVKRAVPVPSVSRERP